MYVITSEQVIGSYAVRYKTLVDLINLDYAGNESDKLSIFVDCTGIFKSITSRPIQCKDRYSIVSSIINLCAHYRNFFEQYYHVSTKFHIILSSVDNNSINAKNVPGYERTYFGGNPAINEIIEEAGILLSVICPYIYDMEFVYTSYEFGVYVYDVIQAENPLSLILTKDVYNFQLVSDDGMAVKVLRPKKDNGVDKSFIINGMNAIANVSIARKTRVINTNLSPSLISLIFALSRLPERNLKGIHQLPGVIESLDKLVKSGVIMNNRTTDIEYVCSMLREKKLINLNNEGIIRARFNATDIETQFGAYICDPKVKRYQGINNLYDPEAVKELNQQYFKDCPLDLNVL